MVFNQVNYILYIAINYRCIDKVIKLPNRLFLIPSRNDIRNLFQQSHNKLIFIQAIKQLDYLTTVKVKRRIFQV